MAGPSTRFGFAGRDDATREEAGGDPRSAPTLYGHDQHLHASDLARAKTQMHVPVEAPKDAEIARQSPAPRQARATSKNVPVHAPQAPAPLSGVFGEQTAPIRSGKSRFPAIARFFWRWNTRGSFVPDSRAGWDPEALVIPRNHYGRGILVVVGAALASFIAVATFARLHDRSHHEPSPPVPAAAKAQAQAPATARPAPIVQAVVPAVVPPAAVPSAVKPLATDTATKVLPVAAKPAAQPESPSGTGAAKTRVAKPQAPIRKTESRPASRDPDSPLPLNL
jgi:hypothetical protein